MPVTLAQLRLHNPQERFLHWITARESARYHKELIGGPGPHSDDPIIAVNRFCNVNREHDAVTRWVKANVRDRWGGCGRQSLLVQVLTARLWNHPPTLARLLPYVSYSEALATLQQIRAEGGKTMRGAYMMPVHGNHGKGKSVDEYYLQAVEQASHRDWTQHDTFAAVAKELTTLLGIGEFLANQVCADLRYTPEWRDAPDWCTFVLCGPGTRRGIDRWAGNREPTGNRPQKVYVDELLNIRETIPELADNETFSDPNNLSNCFCEWDKWERVLWEEVKHLHSYP